MTNAFWAFIDPEKT